MQEEIVTVEEANEMFAEQEEHLNQVIGGVDDSKCTYSQGYVERQAVYSCVTCDPFHKQPAALCHACSLHCHHDHVLIELYTKRDIRCDCGNSKFPDFECTFIDEMDALNEKNKYNQNYSGKYCKCHKPYPDPEDDIEDEMLQCVICEDWYHSRHLNNLSPEDYSEMSCDMCNDNFPFLYHYKHLTVSASEEDKVDVVNDQPKIETTEKVDGCLVLGKKEQLENKTLYWKDGWREELCRCQSCMSLYTSAGVGFITRATDTLAVHEQRGKERAERELNEIADTLQQMDHVKKIEIFTAFNEMKTGLEDFLGNFKGEVVKKEDITQFFDELKSRKRKHNQGVPPSDCKNKWC